MLGPGGKGEEWGDWEDEADGGLAALAVAIDGGAPPDRCDLTPLEIDVRERLDADGVRTAVARMYAERNADDAMPASACLRAAIALVLVGGPHYSPGAPPSFAADGSLNPDGCYFADLQALVAAYGDDVATTLARKALLYLERLHTYVQGAGPPTAMWRGTT